MPQHLASAHIDSLNMHELFCVHGASAGHHWSHGMPTSVRLSSMMPLQSSSMPLHVSGLVGKTGHMYSHPSEQFMLRSLKPGVQAPQVHAPLVQVLATLGALQARPQPPQFIGSVLKSNPSSTAPLQLLSLPSHSSPMQTRTPRSRQAVLAGQPPLSPAPDASVQAAAQ